MTEEDEIGLLGFFVPDERRPDLPPEAFAVYLREDRGYKVLIPGISRASAQRFYRLGEAHNFWPGTVDFVQDPCGQPCAMTRRCHGVGCVCINGVCK